MKLLSVRCITSAYDYIIRSESGMVCGGFLEAGLVTLWTKMKLIQSSTQMMILLKILTNKLIYFQSLY